MAIIYFMYVTAGIFSATTNFAKAGFFGGVLALLFSPVLLPIYCAKIFISGTKADKSVAAFLLLFVALFVYAVLIYNSQTLAAAPWFVITSCLFSTLCVYNALLRRGKKMIWNIAAILWVIVTILLSFIASL